MGMETILNIINENKNKFEPLISVVIPTYKRKSLKLKHAIESVFNQTYKNIEIIVVDDNSDQDYSNDILNNINFNDRLIYIKHLTNLGACAARNTGIMNSNAEYIAFLDDDDTWDKTKLEKQISHFIDEEVGLVYCGIKYYYEKEKKEVLKCAKTFDNPSKNILISNFIGSTSCGVVRKSAALKVGMFDVNLKSGQDLDFWYRISLEYKIAAVKECLLNYTVYEKGTITSNVENRLLSNMYLRNKYKENIDQDVQLSLIYEMKILKAYLELKDYKKAIEKLKNIKFSHKQFVVLSKFFISNISNK